MKKYVAIYQATPEKLAEWMNAPPEEQQSGMAEWDAWAKSHVNDIVEMGAPLGKNKRISNKGVADEKNPICGYAIVQAESHDEAAKVFTDNPHIKETGAWIDVLEWVDM